MTRPGKVVILNGAPRSGKSSIVKVIQRDFPGVWINLGVDVSVRHMTPEALRPGIGLRPGGERPDLESNLPTLYTALYDSIAAHSRLGLNVVADFGHHDDYSQSLGILPICARRLKDLPAYLVGVRCPLEAILERRRESPAEYLAPEGNAPIQEPILRWQEAVHRPGIYDLEVDTSNLSPEACAESIRRLIEGPDPPTALPQLSHEEKHAV